MSTGSSHFRTRSSGLAIRPFLAWGGLYITTRMECRSGRAYLPLTWDVAPYGPPALRGDGRNMLRPYGFTRTYPSQHGDGGGFPLSRE